MEEIISANPWLLALGLAILVPITGIVCGTVATYFQKVRKAELDASLKHAMLEKGMSAEEIRTVLEASSDVTGLKKVFRDLRGWRSQSPCKS
jgi:hypothetical protein